MSLDDLSSIPGLEDKHVQALGNQLHITTFRGLASAESGVIYRAMSRFRPRPGPEEIANWQDQARRKLSTPVVDPSDWHPAASFAVVFSHRQTSGRWERRIEAERTEVEPELPLFASPSWDCGLVCGWMLDQLPQYDGDEGVPETHVPDSAPTGATEEPAATAIDHKTRARLRIESATLTDVTGTADLIQAGVLVANSPIELIPPARATVTVTGAQPGHEVVALASIRARGESTSVSTDPVTADDLGRAELNLQPLRVGEHDMKFLAWAPDATAYMVSMRLLTTIKPHRDC